MSLITDALQKAQYRPGFEPTSPKATPPSSPRPPWWSVAALIAASALIVWIWPATNRRSAGRSTASTRLGSPTTRPQPIMAFVPAAPTTPAMTWKLDGVIVGRGRPTAIVNGELVEEGDEVRGAKVVSVKKDGVELLHDGELVRVAVDTEKR